MGSMTAQCSRRTFLRAVASAACFLERPGLAMTESVHRHLAVLDAPSNLGLKPPSPGREPGVKNMPGVLRAHGIMQRLRAEDAGSVVPPPYAGAVWIGGYHRWDGGRYVWVPGRWDRPPHPGARWEPGRWDHGHDGYRWREGRWR